MSLPTIAFDTSALNALAKGGSDCDLYVSALKSGYRVLLTAMSVDELIATSDPHRREVLIASLQRLLAAGECIWPPHEILSLLVTAHADNPGAFDWQQVGVRAKVYERAIIDRDYSDALSAQQSNEQELAEQQFMAFWATLRPKLEPIFAIDPTKRPRNYRQAAQIARTATPNLIWAIGRGLYKRAAGKDISDDEIDVFQNSCPPFRAACYGLCGSWYDVALARSVFKKLAGRNDQMMSIYLPYCTQFVTRDKKQFERLRDVAIEAKLNCRVVYYDDFCTSFHITS